MEVSLRNHTPKNGLKILEVARKDIKIESTNYPSKREVDTFYVGKVSKDLSGRSKTGFIHILIH